MSLAGTVNIVVPHPFDFWKFKLKKNKELY